MRRKGTPCACECDPCKGKNYVRAVNNVSPDANGDFEILAGNGIGISQSGDNSITIINQAMASSFVAGDNIEINPSGSDLEIRVTDDISVQDIDASGDVNIGGTLNVAGDIIQQGSSYETHAEKVYTTNDYIYMRDGAIAGLGAGDFSGFQVKLYDGINDGRLVIDNSGTARVGDVGDEQPLLTRDESADLTDGDLLQWDATGMKAIGKDIDTLPFTKHSYDTNTDNTTTVAPLTTVQITNASITIPAGINIINVSMSVGLSANAYVLIGIGGDLNMWCNNAISSSSGEMAISGSYIINNNAPLTICPKVNHRGSSSVTPNVSISAVTLN